MVLATSFKGSSYWRSGIGSIPGPPPSPSKAAAYVAFNAEINFKESRYGTYRHNSSSLDTFSLFERPDPLDLSLSKTDNKWRFAVEQHQNIFRCFTHGSTNHMSPNCPSRKAKHTSSSQKSVHSDATLKYNHARWS